MDELDELHDLARRLVARQEPDTHELLASRAFHDADLLFAAVDKARQRARSVPARHSAKWRSVAEALDDAAVYALRVNALGQAPGRAQPNGAIPPPVTISIGAIREGLADPTDDGAFLTDLLAAAQQMLHLSGNGWLWNEIGYEVDNVLDEGGSIDDTLEVVRRHVYLTD